MRTTANARKDRARSSSAGPSLPVPSEEGVQNSLELEPDSMRTLASSMSPDGLNVKPKPLPAGRRQTRLQPFQHTHLQPIPSWFHFNCVSSSPKCAYAARDGFLSWDLAGRGVEPTSCTCRSTLPLCFSSRTRIVSSMHCAANAVQPV